MALLFSGGEFTTPQQIEGHTGPFIVGPIDQPMILTHHWGLKGVTAILSQRATRIITVEHWVYDAASSYADEQAILAILEAIDNLSGKYGNVEDTERPDHLYTDCLIEAIEPGEFPDILPDVAGTLDPANGYWTTLRFTLRQLYCENARRQVPP